METNLGSFQTAWSIGNQEQERLVHHKALGDSGMQKASTPQQSSPVKEIITVMIYAVFCFNIF